MGRRVIWTDCSFWLTWFINQRALYNHALSHHHHWHHPMLASVSVSSSGHTSPGTWLDIETSYLVHICTYVPHICTPNIIWFWLVVFKWQPFWYFSLICYPAHIGSHRDFISHVLKYHLLTYIHKWNNATVTFFVKFVGIFQNSYILHFSEAPCALTYAWSIKANLCTLIIWQNAKWALIHMDPFFIPVNCDYWSAWFPRPLNPMTGLAWFPVMSGSYHWSPLAKHYQ